MDEMNYGWNPPSAEAQAARAGVANIQTHRENNGLPPLIPRSEWIEMSHISAAPKEIIEYQNPYSSCTTATATGAMNCQRLLRGQPFVKLSWQWLYDQVNDGRDKGSNIYRANEVVRRLGIPPLESYPKPTFKANRNPTGVPYYREGVEIRVDMFDELATAILMGILPQFPVDAGNCQSGFTSEGVGRGNGKSPNHSVYAAGLKQIGGQWYVLGVNSWGATWGPFGNGTWLMTERQINDCDYYTDGIGHAVTLNPEMNSGSAE